MIQGLCMFDAQNRLLVWNERYRAMYNIDRGRIWRGCTIRDLLDARIAAGTFPLDPGRYDAELRAALKQGKTFTLNVELNDGRIIAVVNQPIKGGGWVATHEDITERKRAERELEHTRTFLDTIIENVPSPIIVKDVAEPALSADQSRRREIPRRRSRHDARQDAPSKSCRKPPRNIIEAEDRN